MTSRYYILTPETLKFKCISVQGKTSKENTVKIYDDQIAQETIIIQLNRIKAQVNTLFT